MKNVPFSQSLVGCAFGLARCGRAADFRLEYIFVMHNP